MTEKISLIRTEAEYRDVLERVTKLVDRDPDANSSAGRELELLAFLLQEYEKKAYPLAEPNPVAAIRFRMDQLGMTPKDLIPFIGSRSKVSEVLGNKRPLSLTMIRALHDGLGIPLESLIAETSDSDPQSGVQWDRFPIREMVNRGWVEGSRVTSRGAISFAAARDFMEHFLKPIGGLRTAMAALNKTDQVRTAKRSDRYALAAWAAFVRRRAEQVKMQVQFHATEWGPERIRELRSLSRYDVGPRLAIQFLRERGIIVIVEKHLKRTRLDGAAMLRSDGTPVIGLTLRHDRVDNFWFTLFHELTHVLRHLISGHAAAVDSYFIDDLDVPPDAYPLEKEADSLAREALLSKADFEVSAANFVVAPATVSQLAQQLGIADAIVAGRVRYERHNYRLLSSMIGIGKVRELFPETDYSTESLVENE